jgi:glycosyltransferase involved in cell wall biosynthesis
MVLQLSVAIPTFNGRQRLPKVLEHLRAQIVAPEVTWEIWVIDNNSQDGTADYIAALQKDWDGPAPLRYCWEPCQGEAFARQRAIEESSALWVGFIDDDNWPDPDWVTAACRFAQEHGELSAFGSRICGEYEISPPQGFDSLEGFLAIRDHGEGTQPFCPELLRLPPGAGLVVHRQRWLEAVPTRLKLVGRQGRSCIGGEDYAALLYLYRAGGAIGYNPQMSLRHYIPARRLQADYLLPLAYGMGLTTCAMRFILVGPFKSLEIGIRTCLGGLQRLVLYQWRYGSAMETDLVRGFEFFFFLGGCLSPFYALTPQLANWLSFDRIQPVVQKLWRLFPSSSRPTTLRQPSAQPLNLF